MTHYRRVRRLELNGPPKPRPERSFTSHGYVKLNIKDHPAAAPSEASKRVMEHRAVFHDAHGFGPFKCHWCGCHLEWADVCVDHVNTVKTDNRLDNLVPACNECNVSRAQLGRPLTAFGQTKPIVTWARENGLNVFTINDRIRRGWSIERAVSQPIDSRGGGNRHAA